MTQYGDCLIRNGVEEDIESIEAIVNEAVPLMRSAGNFQWGPDYPTAEHFLRDAKLGQLYVAEIDCTVVGVGALTEDQGEDYKQIWDIDVKAVVPHRMCVSPACRGKGVAKAFLMHAEALSRERSYASVRVDTNSKNEPMHHILETLGYKYLGPLELAGREGQEFHAFEKMLN